MKILLIQPNISKEADSEFGALQYPFNLGYLASVLREAGHEVKMVDFNVIDRRKLSGLISEYQPNLVGLTAMAITIHSVEEIIYEVRAVKKDIITVLGGVFASALPKDTMLKIKNLDYLIFGQGEKTIVDLVEHIIKKKKINDVRGVVFRKKGKIIQNLPQDLIKELDTIPFPARDLLPMELYAKRHVVRGFSRKEMKIIEMITSRGCPNQCIFCASKVIYGNSLRYRSYDNIVEEIEECIEKYGVEHITFMDDTFTINKELVRKLCGFFSEKKLTWDCNARVDAVNYELLRLMVKSGCVRVSFGVESGSDWILKKIKKNITVQQVINAIKDTKKAGVRYVECCFMIGSHIDETLDDVAATNKLIHKLMPDILALSIMCPYPGTEVYDMMVERGYLDKNPDWTQFSLFGNLDRYKGITHMNSDQMFKLQHKIIKEYYSSPRYIFSQLIQIRTFREIKYFLRMGKVFLKKIILK